MDYSHGKYLTFVDSDDFIAETTLKEMYSVAQNFDADVVACEKYFELIGKDTRLTTYINRSFVEKPTLITDDLSERVADMAKKNFIFSMCMKLIRKEFLLAENLKCLNIIGEDALLTWCMLCTAKKYVLIPNVTYFYRLDSGSSISRNLFEVEKLFHKWFHSIIEGFKYLDEFLNEQEFFKKHLDLKYALLDTLVKEFNQYLLPACAQIPAWQLDPFVRRELEEIEDTTALTAYFFARMNIFNVQLNQTIKLLNQRAKATQGFRQQQTVIQQQQSVIQTQAAQLKQLQHRLNDIHDIFK